MHHTHDAHRFTGDDYVDSPRNARVREAARLYKRAERDRLGAMLTEGVWPLRTALQGGIDVLDVFYCTDLLRDEDLSLIGAARRRGARTTRVSARALQRISYRDGPDGIVSVVRKPAAELARSNARPLICVVESIAKPGNLGAIIRTACAAGADMVVVCDPHVDVSAPAVVRASLGATFLLPVAVTTSARAIAWLRGQRIAICATTPSGTSDPWSADLSGACAIVIGNEWHGLGAEWLKAADLRLRIPMSDAMNSLNASTAAGIVLFEAVRQRGLRPRDHEDPSGRRPRVIGGRPAE